MLGTPPPLGPYTPPRGGTPPYLPEMRVLVSVYSGRNGLKTPKSPKITKNELKSWSFKVKGTRELVGGVPTPP